MIEAQTAKLRAENDKQFQIDLQKSLAETDRIRAETQKLNRESRWFPVGIIAAAIVAVAGIFGIVAGILKFFGLLKGLPQ